MKSPEVSELAKRHHGYFRPESSADALRFRLREARAEIPGGETLRFYSFRHALKNRLEIEGHSREDIARIMGHRSTRSQENYRPRNEEPRADYGVTRLHRSGQFPPQIRQWERKQNHRSGEQTRSGTVNDSGGPCSIGRERTPASDLESHRTGIAARRTLFFAKLWARRHHQGAPQTEFMLTRPEGVYPLLFANQVSEFEKGGEPWPWQGKEEPLRRSALLCVIKETRHVGLAITTPREARQWLEPSKLNWAKRPGYQLTLLITDEGAQFIQDILNPMTDFNDPFYQKQKTYQEWRAILRGLAPEKERYRHHIERVLRWIELDGEQESAERYDSVMRALPEPGYQPEIMQRVIGPVQLLGNGG